MDDESQYYPFTTTDLTGHKVLLLSPHPDDESLTSGGSLALHVMNGDPVKVVFLTDGAEADTRAEYSHDEYVQLRQNEAKHATTILGITDIEFWNAPDRGLAQAHHISDRLCSLFREYQPTLVYAPSPHEFHPDHRATARLVWQVVQKTMIGCKVAFYDYNRPVNINTLVDITAVIEKKREASNCYHSQLKYYPYADCAISLNRYRSLTVSPGCLYAEGYYLMESREIWGHPIETFTVKQFLPASGHDLPPLVSVIIRTRNRPLLLREAIASILTQTYRNIEVVVVNDGGEDITRILDEFHGYLRIQHICHVEPLGRAVAANSGLRAAKGKYVNFLDDDDIFYAQHLEKLANYLETAGEQFAYSDCETCDYRWAGDAWIPASERRLFNGTDFDRERLDRENFIAFMCAMFRRELFELSGPFDETLEFLEDWDLWIRMSRSVDFHRVPGVTAEYRRFSKPQYDNQAWTIRIYEKYRDYWDTESAFAALADQARANLTTKCENGIRT
jgi:LmbE family N-acetylglucosaminyl deacetylase